ncbi:hypothetical protein [Elizabethkingia miricola]|uniref:hypothetical protein n=1 Tax=Elizabethkingia miricola TaxID=172045 RepID=UPI002ACDC927|nr:hypothetical protein [Elizabethkingia miricola]WQM38790.1 hypothetical protein U2S95_00715 [Elizabethkingia miricola]
MTKDELLKELEANIEVILFKYENLFKTSGVSVEEFHATNHQKINSEISSATTEIIHKGIMNNSGISGDNEFTQSLLNIGRNAASRFMAFLKRSV